MVKFGISIGHATYILDTPKDVVTVCALINDYVDRTYEIALFRDDDTLIEQIATINPNTKAFKFDVGVEITSELVELVYSYYKEIGL